MSSISGIGPALPPISFQAPSSVQRQDPDGDGDIGSENTIGDKDSTAKSASSAQSAGSAGSDGDSDSASASRAVKRKLDISA